MQRKTKTEYAKRFDGKFNIWRKQDVYYHDERGVLYGDWELINVCKTQDEAIEAARRK